MFTLEFGPSSIPSSVFVEYLGSNLSYYPGGTPDSRLVAPRQLDVACSGYKCNLCAVVHSVEFIFVRQFKYHSVIRSRL